jgi:hypothetical protein
MDAFIGINPHGTRCVVIEYLTETRYFPPGSQRILMAYTFYLENIYSPRFEETRTLLEGLRLIVSR